MSNLLTNRPYILQVGDGQLSIQEESRTKILQTTMFIQLGCPTYKIMFFISYDSFYYRVNYVDAASTATSTAWTKGCRGHNTPSKELANQL